LQTVNVLHVQMSAASERQAQLIELAQSGRFYLVQQPGVTVFDLKVEIEFVFCSRRFMASLHCPR
jgi:hypothetical protein